MSWGDYDSTPTQAARVGIHVSRSSTASQSTFTVQYQVQFTQAVNSTMTLTLTGHITGSYNFRHTGGTHTVTTRTRTDTRQYGSSLSRTFAASLSGVYNGLSPSHSVKSSVPARPYSVPNAPSNVSAKRNNDGSITITWKRTNTTARPWDEVQIQQWNNTDSWSSTYLYTRSGTTTSLTNTGGVSSNRKYRYRVRAKNSAGWGSWAYSGYVYTSPAAPSGASVSRNSDTQHTISWTNNNTGSGGDSSYEDVRVYRWDNVSGSYSHIVTLGHSTTSYVDRSTRADRRYRYRVRARNSTAYSGYSTTSYISTTPAAPSGVTAAKSGNDIKLTWTNNATHADGIEVWHAADGVWDSSALAILNGQPTSYTHSNPDPDVTHTYRLKSRETADSGPNLYSVYSSSSNTVQLLTNPATPSNLSPNGRVRDADESFDLTFRHNPVDTTDQTAYEVQWRYVGGTLTSSGKISSGTSRHTINAGELDNGNVVEWRVRTWGQYEDPSPWSSFASITLSSAPTATIQSPEDGEVVDISTLTVTWTFFDAEGGDQREWTAVLYDANGSYAIETASSVGSNSSHTFSRRIANNTSYRVGVQVRDDTGLWSEEAIHEFSVEYAIPPLPEVTGDWRSEDATVNVSVSNPDAEENERETVYNELWRSADPKTARLLGQLHEAIESRTERGLDEPITNLVTNPRGRTTDGTVTVHENLVTNPRGRRTSGTVTIRENLSLDPRPRDAWGGTTDPTMTFMGKPSQLATSGTMVVGENVAARRATVVAGKTYTITLWLRSPEAFTGQIRYYLYGASTVSDLGPEVPVPANEWTPVSATFEVAEGQTATLPMVYGAPSGQTWWVGAALIEEGEASLPYFDGDTWDGDPDFTPEWTGTPGESTSRLVAPRLVGWNGHGFFATAYYSETRDAIALSSWGGGTSPYVYAVGMRSDIADGATCVMSVETSDGQPVEVALFGNSATYESSKQSVESGGTYRLLDGSPGRLTLRATITGGRTVYVRAAVVPGKYDGPYFDGDTWDDDPDLTPEWTGTPDGSTSRLVAPSPVGWSLNQGSGAIYYSETHDAVAVRPAPLTGWTYGHIQVDAQDGPTTMSMWVLNPNDEELVIRPMLEGGSSVYWTLQPGENYRTATEQMSGTAFYFPRWAQIDDQSVGKTIYVRANLVPGEYDGPYFDAHMEDTGDTAFIWEGEEGESPSIAIDTGVPAAQEEFDRSWNETSALISDTVPTNSTVTDYIPAVGAENVYMAIAYSDLPSSNASEPFIVSTKPQFGWIYINGGPEFSDMVRFQADGQISPKFSRDKKLNKFAGREYPVETVGEGRNRDIEVSARIRPAILEASSSDEIEELADLPGPHVLRDPLGHRWFVSVGEVAPDYESNRENVSISMTQVDHNA